MNFNQRRVKKGVRSNPLEPPLGMRLKELVLVERVWSGNETSSSFEQIFWCYQRLFILHVHVVVGVYCLFSYYAILLGCICAISYINCYY